MPPYFVLPSKKLPLWKLSVWKNLILTSSVADTRCSSLYGFASVTYFCASPRFQPSGSMNFIYNTHKKRLCQLFGIPCCLRVELCFLEVQPDFFELKIKLLKPLCKIDPNIILRFVTKPSLFPSFSKRNTIKLGNLFY